MNRFLRVTAEQAYGVFDTTSPAFAYYIPMDGPGTFKPSTARPFWNLRDPKSNVPRARGSEVYAVGGVWTGRHYWDQPTLAMLTNRINSGLTTPWPTNCKATDLPSVTLDFGWSYYDLTLKRARYLGCKIGESWELSCGNDPSNPFLNYSYPWIGSKSQPNAITTTESVDLAPTALEFPEPDEDDYPDLPLSFFQCVFTTQGAAVDYFDRFTIRGQQMCKGYYDSKRFLNRISHNGRTVTLTAHLRLDAANDPRTRYEALTALGATTIVFTKPADTETLTLNFRSQSYLDSVDEETPLDDDSYTTMSATAFLDGTAGDDFTITYAT